MDDFSLLGVLHGKPKFLAWAHNGNCTKVSTRDPRKTRQKFVFRLSSLLCGIEVLINIEKDQLLCDFGFVCKAKQMKIEKDSMETHNDGVKNTPNSSYS